MKKIIISIAIITQILSAQELWEQKDKQQHFALSGAVSALTTAYFINNGYSKTEAFFYGVGTSMILGLAKEAYDQYDYNGASTDDMYADLAGAAIGSAISCQFSWEF